jgi:hypothetical protein
MTAPNTTPPDTTPPQDWWRIGMVWLVIGGPLAVLIASFVTQVIALRGADDILPKEMVTSTPAVQARNHAATPGAARP